jgi:uncharacterized protein (TIGR03437 family)
VIRRLAALAAICPAAWAQFDGLATPHDGSVVYFASTLRLKGANQPRHGKLFVAGEQGVRLFRSRERVDLPAGLPCTLGEFYAFTGAEVSADGNVIAAAMQRTWAGLCSSPNLRGAAVISGAGEREVPGVVRLSPSGRYAVVFNARTASVFSPVDVFLLDLSAGAQFPVSLPPTAFPSYLSYSPAGGRVIADDGTAILSYGDMGFLIRPGSEPEPFPVAQAVPLLISADGAKVLYSLEAGLRLLNLRTREDRLVIPAGNEFQRPFLSDDGERLLFLRAGQAYVIRTDGTGLRALTTDPPETIQAAALAGNGRIAYAAAAGERGARLLKINTGTGEQTEIIGPTPYLHPVPGLADAGLAVTVTGLGLSDVSLQAAPPLKPWLGSLTMWMEERKVPVLEVTPTSVRFLVPWDIRPRGSGEMRILAETPAPHTPFDSPETYLQVHASPRAGLIAHENWDGLVGFGLPFGTPPRRGEIIHIWAVGLGAVSPEPLEGTPAPSAEPLARLARPLACSDSEVLYAGLAPGYLERIYQVDLRLGDVTGYVQFFCSFGGEDRFIFLSLNVLP